MKAEIEIDCKEPERIIESLKPDADDTDKFNVTMKTGKEKLTLIIDSKDITGLLAAVNSYLRMIKTLTDLEEIK